MYYYSKLNNGFYSEEVHGKSIPKDAVKISNKQYLALLEGQSLGKRISSDGEGKPHLLDPQEYNLSQVEVEILRLKAYADPVNGSDRYFMEALSLQAEGFSSSSAEVKAARNRGLERKREINLLYPLPVNKE